MVLNMSDILRDIVRATCGGQSQRVKDYIYEEMVNFYNSHGCKVVHREWERKESKNANRED